MCKRTVSVLLLVILMCCLSIPALAAQESYNFTFSEPEHWILMNWEFDPFMVILTIPSSTAFTVDVTSYLSDVTVTLQFSEEVPWSGLEAMTVSDNGSTTLPITPTSYSGDVVSWKFARSVPVGYLYGTSSNCALTSSTISSYAPGASTPIVTFDYVEPEEEVSSDTWFSSFGDWFSDLGSTFSKGFSDISGWLSSLGSSITGALSDLGSFILDGLKNLFVPSDDYFSNKLFRITDAFSFYKEALAFGDSIQVYFNNIGHSSPPALEFTLDAPNSQFWSSGAATIKIDFAWYAPYKPYVDNMLGAFILIMYFYRVFLALPSIISGGSGFITSGARFEANMDREAANRERATSNPDRDYMNFLKSKKR